jgi:hypothetical protein
MRQQFVCLTFSETVLVLWRTGQPRSCRLRGGFFILRVLFNSVVLGFSPPVFSVFILGVLVNSVVLGFSPPIFSVFDLRVLDFNVLGFNIPIKERNRDLLFPLMMLTHLSFHCYVPPEVCVPLLESVLVQHASCNGPRRFVGSASHLVYAQGIDRTGTTTNP